MLPKPVVIERFSWVAPLGLNFWDGVTQRVVGDGLAVVAYLSDKPEQRVQAYPNRSGVYVFHRLPGFGRLDGGDGEVALGVPLAAGRDLTIEVGDPEGRYLPFRFPINSDLPVWGTADLPCELDSPLGSPLAATPALIPMYSSSARPVPGGMAVVRADLNLPGLVTGKSEPARWAVLEAYYQDPRRGRQRLGRGLADTAGRVCVIFPYPSPATSSDPSAALGTQARLAEQAWQVELQVRYSTPDPEAEVPDLCQALNAPFARFVSSPGPVDVWFPDPLGFGQELVVRTPNLSHLLILP